MKLKDRPWALYVIIILAFIAAGTLWRTHEDFSTDITIELLGSVITILIIDQLLLKSERKRWNLVKNEVEYILARTINILRDEVLRNMFQFRPKIDPEKDLRYIDDTIREQKDTRFNELINMPKAEMLEILENGFVKRYDDHFQEQAEGLWRIMNTKYSDHLEPEVVDELLKLHLYLNDLHNSIRMYKRGDDDVKRMKYYRQRGGNDMVQNTKKMIERLVSLKKMGYSRVSYRR